MPILEDDLPDAVDDDDRASLLAELRAAAEECIERTD
jgi:hypothetical protein